jgi:hypothetical protein
MKETFALHGGLVALATALYAVPLVVGVVSGAPHRPPLPILDDGDAAVEARFSPLPVVIDEPADAPEPEEPQASPPPAPPAPATPILPSSADGPPLAVVTPSESSGPDLASVEPHPPRAHVGAPRKGKPAKRICDEPNPHVRTGPDGVVEIDRSLVDAYTDNLESFMRLGYSEPYDEDGVKGWYISGFGCGSPVYKAGFRRADVLLSVNGKPTRSWVGVFFLYQKLKNREDFEVALVRKGEPMTLRFRVVSG